MVLRLPTELLLKQYGLMNVNSLRDIGNSLSDTNANKKLKIIYRQRQVTGQQMGTIDVFKLIGLCTIKPWVRVITLRIPPRLCTCLPRFVIYDLARLHTPRP